MHHQDRRPGCFITLEGGEGAGKSTQAALLATWLQEQTRREVVLTREPGGTPLGQSLRQLLLAPGEAEPSPTAELLLYAADRAEHIARLIRPALERDAVVLCDRFTDSTIAYQGFGRGLDRELIDSLNRLATTDLRPDLTLWFCLDPVEGLARRSAPDRLEAAGLEFHRRVHAGFVSLAAAEPDRIYPLDASCPVETVAARVRAVVGRHLDLDLV